MKSILFSAVVAFCSLPVLAQKPAYPSKEQVLKDARSASALSSINQIYNSTLTWDKIKVEYKTFVNGGELSESFFYDFESDVSKRLGLDINDATHIYVLATTPKDKEGFYYEVLIDVTYSSYNATMPLGKWVLKSSYVGMNDYYQRGGDKNAANKRMTEVISILKKFKGHDHPDAAIKFTTSDLDYAVISIDSVYKNPEKQDEALTYQRMWNYMAKCQVAVYEDGLSKIEKYATATMEIRIEWNKPENGGNDSWYVDNVDFGYPRVINGTEKKPGQAEQNSLERYKWLSKYGFETIYKKKETFTRSRNSLGELEAFQANMQNALKKMYENPEAGKADFAALVNPKAANKDAIVNSYYEQVVEAKKYMMNLDDATVKSSADYEDGQIKFFSTTVVLRLDRPWVGNDKAMMKKYKDAGVSKQTLTSTGGQLSSRIFANDPEFVLVDNNWYLNTAAEPKEKNFD